MNPFSSSLQALWERAEYCSVYGYYFKSVAIELAKKELNVPSWREPIFPELDDDTFLEFLGVTNSINFCFTDPGTGKKFDAEYPDGSGNIYRGSSAMTACVKRALDNGVPILSPKYLAKFSRTEADLVFWHYSNPIPMVNMRIGALRNVGDTLLEEDKPHSFSKIFSNAGYRLFNNGDGIVEKIAEQFMSYHDESRWRGFKLLFYKRAQLLPMIYHGRAIHSKGRLPLIHDPENFGAITDNAVPNALRILGILQYKREIAQMIDNNERISSESQIELEIRAVSAQIMIGLLSLINKYRIKFEKPKITMAELDYFIWQIGRKPSAKYKPHLTYTTAY